MRKSEIEYQKMEKPGWCGPRALYYVYKYFNHPVEQFVLAQEMGTTEEWGTPVDKIRENLSNRGLHYRESIDTKWETLQDYANREETMVIVNWWSNFDSDPSEDCGHWSAVEYVNKDVIGLIGEGLITKHGFESRWYDVDKQGVGNNRYMLVVERPKRFALWDDDEWDDTGYNDFWKGRR